MSNPGRGRPRREPYRSCKLPTFHPLRIEDVREERIKITHDIDSVIVVTQHLQSLKLPSKFLLPQTASVLKCNQVKTHNELNKLITEKRRDNNKAAERLMTDEEEKEFLSRLFNQENHIEERFNIEDDALDDIDSEEILQEATEEHEVSYFDDMPWFSFVLGGEGSEIINVVFKPRIKKNISRIRSIFVDALLAPLERLEPFSSSIYHGGTCFSIEDKRDRNDSGRMSIYAKELKELAVELDRHFCADASMQPRHTANPQLEQKIEMKRNLARECMSEVHYMRMKHGLIEERPEIIAELLDSWLIAEDNYRYDCCAENGTGVPLLIQLHKAFVLTPKCSSGDDIGAILCNIPRTKQLLLKENITYASQYFMRDYGYFYGYCTENGYIKEFVDENVSYFHSYNPAIHLPRDIRHTACPSAYNLTNGFASVSVMKDYSNENLNKLKDLKVLTRLYLIRLQKCIEIMRCGISLRMEYVQNFSARNACNETLLRQVMPLQSERILDLLLRGECIAVCSTAEWKKYTANVLPFEDTAIIGQAMRCIDISNGRQYPNNLMTDDNEELDVERQHLRGTEISEDLRHEEAVRQREKSGEIILTTTTRTQLIMFHAAVNKCKLFTLGLSSVKNREHVDIDFVNEHLYFGKSYAIRNKDEVHVVANIANILNNVKNKGVTLKDRMPSAYAVHVNLLNFVVLNASLQDDEQLREPLQQRIFNFFVACAQLYSYKIVRRNNRLFTNVFKNIKNEFFFDADETRATQTDVGKTRWKWIWQSCIFIRSKDVYDSWIKPCTPYMAIARSVFNLTTNQIEEHKMDIMNLITQNVHMYPMRLLSSNLKEASHWALNLDSVSNDVELTIIGANPQNTNQCNLAQRLLTLKMEQMTTVLKNKNSTTSMANRLACLKTNKKKRTVSAVSLANLVRQRYAEIPPIRDRSLHDDDQIPSTSTSMTN